MNLAWPLGVDTRYRDDQRLTADHDPVVSNILRLLTKHRQRVESLRHYGGDRQAASDWNLQVVLLASLRKTPDSAANQQLPIWHLPPIKHSSVESPAVISAFSRFLPLRTVGRKPARVWPVCEH